MFDVQEWLLTKFGHIGYFVEAGAHDGVGDSQTLRLERSGWKGLCVEPSSAYHGLMLSRKCSTDNRAIYSADGMSMVFREMDGEAVELSGLACYFKDHWDRESRPHTERVVKTAKLSTVMAEHGAPKRFQFLSLDTEGSEYAILAAHDFRVYRPLTALIEYNGVQTSKDALAQLFARKDYFFHSDDGINLFFVCNSLMGNLP